MGGLMWNEVISLIREFMGTGLIVIWFLIALIYLWIREKRKHIRILFLYMPIILLFVYFNPLFAGLVYRVVGDEIYYRILWLLPITVVIAYACVCAYGQLSKEYSGKKGLSADIFAGMYALCLAGVIAASGNYIYGSSLFTTAENLYHVPDSVVHICDTINVPGREVMAVFPMELVQYVRQYSPVTCMPYGREVTVDRWNVYPPLCAAMEAEVIDMSQLAPLVREAECHFCILPADKEINGNPEDYGWIWIGETDGYVIYRDPARELIIPNPDN